jgi:tRNA (guanine6-N2)-methyltransferase
VKLNPYYEASVTEGLEAVAYNEIVHRFGNQIKLRHPVDRWPGTLQFTFEGKAPKLMQLKTVLSLFLVQPFPVPRPRALLGHQHFTQLLAQIEAIRKLSAKNAYKTVYLAAAGSDSSVMSRFIEAVAQSTGLTVASDEGDLLIRLRHPLEGGEHWEALIRMTPRPLSTRSWRVCDLKGALNAAVAHAMVEFVKPTRADVFLNLACGSGTLLIEQASSYPAKISVGCDINEEALECARANVKASGLGAQIMLAPWDARALPLDTNSVDILCSDLPFGHYVGTHQENINLYPPLLREAARVAKPGAKAIFLTHEIRLMNTLIEDSDEWVIENVLTLTLNGLHPRIFILRNKEGIQQP